MDHLLQASECQLLGGDENWESAQLISLEAWAACAHAHWWAAVGTPLWLWMCLVSEGACTRVILLHINTFPLRQTKQFVLRQVFAILPFCNSFFKMLLPFSCGEEIMPSTHKERAAKGLRSLQAKNCLFKRFGSCFQVSNILTKAWNGWWLVWGVWLGFFSLFPLYPLTCLHAVPCLLCAHL